MNLFEGLNHSDPRIQTAETAVALSAGVDSVATLEYAIKKFGKDNIVALTTIINLDGKCSPFTLATLFFSKEITKFYGVAHFITFKNVSYNSGFSYNASYLWGTDILIFAASKKNLKRIWSGMTLEDAYHHGVTTNLKYFKETMKNLNRDCIHEHPLSDKTKFEHYCIVNHNVKKFIWTCENLTLNANNQKELNINSFKACGTCYKCKEFKNLVEENLTSYDLQ